MEDERVAAGAQFELHVAHPTRGRVSKRAGERSFGGSDVEIVFVLSVVDELENDLPGRHRRT